MEEIQVANGNGEEILAEFEGRPFEKKDNKSTFWFVEDLKERTLLEKAEEHLNRTLKNTETWDEEIRSRFLQSEKVLRKMLLLAGEAALAPHNRSLTSFLLTGFTIYLTRPSTLLPMTVAMSKLACMNL